MDRLINLRLMAHPMNWLIVWTVALMLGTLIRIVHRNQTGGLPETNKDQ